MPKMYCPQCGRALELDSGEVRFCRYCGFSLADTKDALRGYAEQKRTGFSIVSWSYVLLLCVTLLLLSKWIPIDTRWGYWLSAILVVVSVSFFVSGGWSATKPAMFSKSVRRGKRVAELPTDRMVRDVGGGVEGDGALLLNPSLGQAVEGMRQEEKRTAKLRERQSITEETTKRIEHKNHSA